MPYSVSNNTPSSGYIQWTDVHIVYDGVDRSITNGNSNKKYIYWQLSNPTVLQGSDTYPTLGADDTIVFYNKSGIALSVLQSQVADGGLVVPGTIVSDSLATGAVTADKIQAGSITASKLVLADLTNMIPGADLSDPSAWDLSASVSIEENSAKGNTLNYSRAIKFSSVGVGEKYEVAIPRSNRSNQPRLFEVEEGAYYRIATKALVTAGFNGNLFAILRFWDKSYTDELYTDFQLPIFNGTVTPAAAEQTFDLARIAGPVPVGRGYMEIVYVVYWGEDWNTKTRVGDAYITNPRVYRAAAADLIVDGTITAAKIQTATITADKMLITGNGPTLNRDPQGQDATAWSGSPVILTGQNQAPSNGTALANTTGSSKQVFTVDYIPVDINKNYRLEIWADQTAGTGGVGYLGLACYNSSKTNLDAYLQTSEIRSTWLGAGSYFYYGISGTAFPSNWTRYSVSFGPGEKSKIPSDTKFVRPMAILNHDSTDGVQHAVTGIRLMEKSDADLIVDGSIVASKIEAGAVTTSKLAVGDFNVLARNWNFEDGDFSWTKGSGWSIATNANAKSGTKVAIKTNSTQAQLKNEQIIPTELGETFYAEGFIKHTSGASGTTTVRIMGLNSAGAASVLASGTNITNSITTYTKSSVSATVPANIVSVYVDVQSAMASGTAYVDEVRLFRTSNNTLIADGAITTNKILSNQITADKIQSGQISTDKLTVLASEYVNPVSITGNIRGWAGVSELGQFSSQYASYDTVEKALKIISATDALSVAISSNSWAINHSKIYRVSMEVKKSTANGHYRIGVSAHTSFVGSAEAVNTALSGLNITGYAPNRQTSVTLASFDAASETNLPPTTYVTHVFYLIGANRSINDCPNHVSPAGLESDYPYVLLPANATYAQLRLLNWDNPSSKLSNLFVRGISVTEVGAGQIVASNITAGAITAGKIASKAISTDSLIVTGAGASLNADPACEDLNSWENIEFNTPILSTTSQPPVGNTAIANTSGTRSRVATREYIPIDSTKNYRLEIWARRIGTGGGNGSLGILWYNSSKTRITTVPTGWTNNPSTYSTFGISNTTFPDNWTRYRIEFGPNEKAAIPPDAKFVRIMAFLNDSTTSETQHAITNVRLMEKAQADLIVDGSIVADKIAAGAISASKIVVADSSNMIPGANLEDSSAWAFQPSVSIVSGTTETTSLKYPRAIRFSNVGISSEYQQAVPLSGGTSSYFEVEEGANYRISCKALVTAGFNGNLFAVLRFYQYNSESTVDKYLDIFNALGTPASSEQIVNVTTISFPVPEGYNRLQIIYVVHWGGDWATRTNSGNAFVTNPRVNRGINSTLIVDGSITTDKITTNGLDAAVIKTGTLDANRIGANTITADKLVITGNGASLNSDPNGQDSTAWIGGMISLTGLTDSPLGSTAASHPVGSGRDILTAEYIPIDVSKNYRLDIWAKQTQGTGGVGYLGLACYNSSKTNLEAYLQTSEIRSTWLGAGTYFYFGRSNQAFPPDWTRYSVSFGPNEATKIPSTTKFVRPLALLNFNSTAGVQHAVTGVRLMEKADADLIVDGTIVGDKIAANTITASKLAVGDFTVLTRNWNFEEGDNDTWEKEAGWSIISDSANSKSGSFVARWSGTNAKALRNVQQVSTEQGETFYGEAYIKRTSTGGSAWVRLRYINSSGQEVGSIPGNVITSSTYTKSAVSVTIPAGVVRVNVEVVGDQGTFYADEVRMFRTSNSTLIANGAITTDKVGANQITGGKIYAGTVEADRISGNSLQTNSIDATKIQAGAVLAEKLAVVTFSDSAILNSNFEEVKSSDPTLPARWNHSNIWNNTTKYVAPYRDTTNFRSGTAGVTLNPGAGGDSVIYSDHIPMVAQEKWYLSCWARSSGTNAGSSPGFYLRIRGGSTSTDLTLEAIGTVENRIVSTSWQKYETAFTIPAGMTWGAATFLNYRSNTGVTIHIDDVTFRKVVSSTLIEDGAITTQKMVADTINGNVITGNTLSGQKIISGSITTNKLFVPSFGAALNMDPNMTDSTAWVSYFGEVPALFTTVSDGKVGNTVARNSYNSETSKYRRAWMNEAKRTPIDPTKTYRVRAWMRRVSGSGKTAYIGVALFDANGGNIESTGAGASQWYYAASGVTLTTTWTEYVGSFGAGSPAGRVFPANARTMSPLFILAYDGEGEEVQEIQDLRIEEVLPGTLIKDGTITTAKISTSGLDANVITTGTLDADLIGAGSITTGKIGAGEVKANNIGADQVNASHLQISNDSESDANGIFMDGTNKKILIKNAGVVRVKIGFLG